MRLTNSKNTVTVLTLEPEGRVSACYALPRPMLKPLQQELAAYQVKCNAHDRPFLPWREVMEAEIDKFGEGGIVLRGSRLKEKLTQMELAKKLGITQHNLSAMENGRRPIGKAMAKRLAAVFKTDYRLFL
jgi:DNA-binding XRE family transcriptional regulator